MSSLDGFLQSVGQVMGASRDSMGSGSPVSTLTYRRSTDGFAAQDDSSSGRASDAHRSAVRQTSNLVQMLDAEDKNSAPQPGGAASSAAAGRNRIDQAIAGAISDVGGLGPSTNTEAGRKALVDRILTRLGDTKSTIADADSDAKARAADAAKSAANYNQIGRPPTPSGIPAMPMGMPMGGGMPMAGGGMPGMGGMPSMPSMGGLPLGALSGLSNLGGLVKQVGAPGGAGLATGGPGGSAQVVGGSAIDQSIAKMMGFLGEKYSWGGGGANGPSKGTGVDANLVGFDCSGLTQYGAAQEGIQIPRHTYAQMKMGVVVDATDIQKGDYVFSNFSGPGQPEHVSRAISPTQVIEAPDRGGHVQISALPAGKIVVKRISAAQ